MNLWHLKSFLETPIRPHLLKSEVPKIEIYPEPEHLKIKKIEAKKVIFLEKQPKTSITNHILLRTKFKRAFAKIKFGFLRTAHNIKSSIAI
jgi:hypothetical protein